MKTKKLSPDPELTRAATLLVSEPNRAVQKARSGLTLAGRYRLDERLGAGGMGEVYRGHHLTLDIPIAVKLMHEEIANAPSYAQRFRQEAQAASRIHQRNVVRVLDFGEDQGTWFIVMEFLDGESLAHLVARGLPSLEVVREAMSDVLSALDAAHQLGVVHRDLKPENVIVTKESDGRVVHKVVDFGLARVATASDAAAERLTKPDSVAGTPEFMSPEQCESLDVGPATDLYAAGCVLTCLLQGTPPFTARSPVEIMARHMFLPPTGLSRPAGSEPVPPALESLRLQLLAKAPSSRPASASEALDQLERAFASSVTGRSESKVVTRSERAPAWERPEPRPIGATVRTMLQWLGESPPGDVLTGLALADCALVPRGAKGGSAKPHIRVLSASTVQEALDALAAADGEVPSVVIAPVDGAADVQRLIEAGAADVVPAPVAVELLTKKLRRVARRGR